MELLTAAQMRAAEQVAIASGRASGLELMERAGRGVVEAIFAEWPALAAVPGRAVVLCGPGNNGGDGFVIARLLKGWGWEVDLFLFGEADKLPPDAKANCRRWSEMGPVRAAHEITDEAQLLDLNAGLFIDALFGTGLTRPVELPSPVLGPFFDYAAQWLYGAGPKTVAVDIPSGVCADSGAVLGGAMMAALTVTFHAAKCGHFLIHPAGEGPTGAQCCGKLAICDIGLPRRHLERLPQEARSHLPEDQRTTVWTIEAPAPAALKPDWGGHKYDHGHALVLAGTTCRTGAARLAARGALRAGAGLVTVGAPPEALAECAAQLTAIMLRRVKDAAGLRAALDDTRINALCIGPGFGIERAADVLPTALHVGRACVLDADALTAIGQTPALMDRLHAGCVLTPHDGEFARMFPDLASLLTAAPAHGPAYGRVDAARAAAARAGCVIVMKGPDTVIAAPDGRVAINAALYERAMPWLATAGAGDVLAGIIAGLMARGLGPFEAARSGAWLHLEAARAAGPGVIAEDIPERLPEVFSRLVGVAPG